MVLTKGPNNVSGPKNVIKKHMEIPTTQFLFTHTHTHTFCSSIFPKKAVIMAKRQHTSFELEKSEIK